MATAPSTPGLYEWQAATSTWMALTAHETVGGTVDGVLTVALDQVAPGAPTAPYNLTWVSKTDTTISVSWQEDPDSTVGGHRIYLGGVKTGTDLAAGALTDTITGLTQSTQYKITVTRFNSTGQESPPSNVLTVTTNTTQAGVPTAPTGLVSTTITDTSMVGGWSETTDASVLRHWRYLNGSRYGVALSATATSGSWPNLTAGTNYTAYVTRENATGESSPSNSVAFKTTGGGTVQHDVAMGVSNSKYDHKLTSWSAMRVYDYSSAQGVVNTYGCRVLSLSNSAFDASTATLEDSTNVANVTDSFLTLFYGWSDATGPTKNLNVELHIGIGNEVDKRYTSGSLPTAFVNSYKLTYAVIHSVDSKGNRKYPKASMWVDMTQFHISSAGTGPRFKALGPYLDGMACSMYPPGRKSQPTVFTDYPIFCGDSTSTANGSKSDAPLAIVVDWHNTYPNCKGFATWEIGIPIDHPTAWTSAQTQPGGEPTAQTDITIRPRYFTGGIDAGGKNWKGFLQYCYDFLDAAGVEMHEQIYWDSQTNPPNQLFHDTNRTTPDTASAWHDWVPGKVLPHG